MDIMLQRILSLIPDRHGADAEFARSIGYKNGNIIADWRAGRSTSYRGRLQRIAERYSVSVDWLCGSSPLVEPPSLSPISPAEPEALLQQLTPAERRRVCDFIAGLLAARGDR